MATNSAIKTQKIPAGYEPISMWGYFGYEILFSLPIIGWILIIVFAFSARNYNLRNFARSQFCLLIIWAVLIIAVTTTGWLSAMLSNML